MSHLRAPKTQPHRISLREVSHLLVLFLLFIMSNLFYRGGGGGGGRAGSNLSILKEAKKNFMGRFIFSRGGGSICLFLFFSFFFVGSSSPTPTPLFLFSSHFIFLVNSFCCSDKNTKTLKQQNKRPMKTLGNHLDTWGL